MRSAYLIVLLAGLSCGSGVFAKLGETEEQTNKRFGEGNEHFSGLTPPSEKEVTYKKDGFFISVAFWKKQVVEEIYHFQNDAKVQDNMDKAKVLLDSNSSGLRWEQVPSSQLRQDMLCKWVREDRKAVAFVIKDSSSTLWFQSQDYIEEGNRLYEQSQKGMSGF